MRSRPLVWLVLALGLGCGLLFLSSNLAQAPVLTPTATLFHPTARPTFAFPVGTPIPITSADDAVLEYEAGPLYVMLSAVDEHGLPSGPFVYLQAQPQPDVEEDVSRAVPSGTFAQVLEIRRLPPDYLRTFYRVEVAGQTGWVGDYWVRRTVFVIVFDAQGCACPGALPLWADSGLSQTQSELANLSPLRVLALTADVAQVQVLADGQIGWLARKDLHESTAQDFIKLIRP